MKAQPDFVVCVRTSGTARPSSATLSVHPAGFRRLPAKMSWHGGERKVAVGPNDVNSWIDANREHGRLGG